MNNPFTRNVNAWFASPGIATTLLNVAVLPSSDPYSAGLTAGCRHRSQQYYQAQGPVREEALTYASNGWLRSRTVSAKGRTIVLGYQYTASGNIRSAQIACAFEPTRYFYKLSFTYDAHDRISAISRSDIPQSCDGQGSNKSETLTFAYDERFPHKPSLATYVMQPFGGPLVKETYRYTYAFNGDSRQIGAVTVTAVDNGASVTTSYTYNPDGTLATSLMSGTGDQHSFAYNAARQLIKTAESGGGLLTTTVDYDDTGRLTNLNIQSAYGPEFFIKPRY